MTDKGYSFLERESIFSQTGKVVYWLTFLSSWVLGKISRRLWNFNLGRSFSPHYYGYPRHLVFLSRLGLWDEYKKVCARLSVHPDSFHTAKAFYYAYRLSRYFGSAPIDVLDIGGGVGIIGAMLRQCYAVSRYDVLEKGGKAPPGKYDLCICSAVFPILTPPEIEEYLALVQTVLKPGGIFFSTTCRKGDNNPLLYPWHDNEILEWEVCPFHFDVLRWGIKDEFMLRIEKIRK